MKIRSLVGLASTVSASMSHCAQSRTQCSAGTHRGSFLGFFRLCGPASNSLDTVSQPFARLWIENRTTDPALTSTEAVHSSMTRTLESRRIARPRHSSCRSPTEKLPAPNPIDITNVSKAPKSISGLVVYKIYTATVANVGVQPGW